MKDSRLYGKFTLDFPDSHKIMPLSDAAFRCLVEATLWSRKHLTDGLLPSRYAVARWSLSVLEELTSNDASNPSLEVVEGGYQIRDFAQHQDTRADIDARRERNKANGQKGGLAKAKRSAKRVGKQVASESVSENVAETETYIKEDRGAFDASFDAFWTAYPRKVGRKAASKAYAKAVTEIDPDTLLIAARSYAQSVDGSDPKFVAHPTTWLNQGRWDEFTPAATQSPEDFVRDCWREGTIAPITDRCGRKPDCIRWPDPMPDDFDRDMFLVDFRRGWIEENRAELVEALRGRL